jgi:acetyl esterase/lipase
MRFEHLVSLTRSLLLIVALATPAELNAAPEPPIALWPADDTLLSSTAVGQPAPSRGDNINRITSVTVPTLTIYRASSSAGTSTPAVLICPGGAYKILAVNIEGDEIARWLNSIGITAAVLRYHVPNDREHALADGQRAIRVLRSRASDLNADPKRVGIIGFSAGGHLAARVCYEGDLVSSHPADTVDLQNCHPDFAALIYPAYLADKQRRLSSDIRVTSGTPPTFIVQTQDDHNFVAGSMAYTAALLAGGVPCEYHLFPTGGHGYGLRKSSHAVSRWPKLCEAWLREIKML